MRSILPSPRAAGALWRDAKLRAIAWQAALLAALAYGGYGLYATTRDNLSRRGIASGFGFLGSEAGFGISETPPIPLPSAGLGLALGALGLGAMLLWLWTRRVSGRVDVIATALLLVALPVIAVVAFDAKLSADSYVPEHDYAFALATGFANTIKIAAIGCVAATLLGLAIGLASQSGNPLLRALARVYVEAFRNVPLLIQIVFWYFGVLRALPGVRDSFVPFGIFVLNNRGVFLPAPLAGPGLAAVASAVLAGLIVAWFTQRWADRRQAASGHRPPAVVLGLLAIATPVVAAIAVFGPPVVFEHPRLAGFNYVGGLQLTPEYGALLFGLTLYTAAFIAEIVRAGLESVPRGQVDAARALGLTRAQALRRVVLPQALRVIVPPLIGQYLSLTKDSSLGFVIAYPELVSVGNTMINHTGQAIEVLVLLMAAYMALNLATSAAMNRYNAITRWPER